MILLVLGLQSLYDVRGNDNDNNDNDNDDDDDDDDNNDDDEANDVGGYQFSKDANNNGIAHTPGKGGLKI